MVRWSWWMLALSGCAGILDEEAQPPIVPVTRDAAVINDQTLGDAQVQTPDAQAPDAGGDAEAPPPDMAPALDRALPIDAAPPIDQAPPVDQAGCVEDVDCAGDLICEDGACVEPQRCVDDAACAADERCEAGECVPGARPECVEDADCANDGRCVDGTCARGICALDADCAVNERCEAARCVPDLIECMGPVDCPMGEACVAGRCAPIPPPDCIDDLDCDPDEICVAGGCEPAPACVDDQGCGPGEICVAGACEPAPPPACVVDGDCGAGEICVQGDCEPAPPPECVGDGDCEVGEICVQGSCEVAPPPECVDDLGCAPFERCVAGACVPECVVDADCAPGATCEANRCVAPPPAPGTCAAPLALGAAPVMGETAGASAVAGACGGAGAPEVVYRHVAAADGPLCIDTAGSAYDTVLYVREDDCDGAELGCSDDGAFAGGLQSDLTIDAVAGQAYAIVVDGYSNRAGAFTVRARSGACGAAPPMPCDAIRDAVLGRQMGSTVDAPSLMAGRCGVTDGAPEVVFRLQVAQAGRICARTAGSDFDTVLYVRTACADAASEIACHDDVQVGVDSTSALSFDAAAGTDYFIVVDGYVSAANGPQSGAFVLELSAGACP